MLDIKVKLLNENPDKILELLNSNKHNLSSLLMQYDNIIELYLQLLGGKDWGKANVNEVIVPEITTLLEDSNYDCEFTSSGIYQDGKAIFTLKYNEHKKQEISIIDGENTTSLYKSLINLQQGIFIYKEIKDFSKLDGNDFTFLSQHAITAINNPSLCSSMSLESISIKSSIAQGIELVKIIEENYISQQNPNEYIHLTSTISYNTNEPTISHRVNSYSSYNNHTFQLYGNDLSNYKSETLYYGYGESKLNLSYMVPANPSIYKLVPISLETGSRYSDYKGLVQPRDTKKMLEREKKYYYQDYDYEKLLENLKAYQNKYPNSMHPLLTRTYMSNWETDFGKTVCQYYIDYIDKDALVRTNF